MAVGCGDGLMGLYLSPHLLSCIHQIYTDFCMSKMKLSEIKFIKAMGENKKINRKRIAFLETIIMFI